MAASQKIRLQDPSRKGDTEPGDEVLAHGKRARVI